MDDAERMRIAESVGHLCDDGQALLCAKPAAALLEQILQRFAAHALHNQVQIAAVGQKIVEGRDVGVGELGETGRLAAKPIHKTFVVEQLRTQRLDGDFALQNGIECGVDLPDAAGAEQLFDLVLTDHCHGASTSRRRQFNDSKI